MTQQQSRSFADTLFLIITAICIGELYGAVYGWLAFGAIGLFFNFCSELANGR